MAVAAAQIGTRIFGTGTTANRVQGSNTSMDNIFGSSVAQTWLNRMAVENYEQNREFQKFAEIDSSPDGYLNYSKYKTTKIAASAVTDTTAGGVTATANTIGVTPATTTIQANSVSVAPKQFVLTHAVSDMITRYTVFPWLNNSMNTLMNAVERRCDEYIQDVLYARATGTGGNVMYAYNGTGTAPTNINGFTSSNAGDTTLKIKQLMELRTMLKREDAPIFPALGTYVLLVHPNVYHGIMSDTSGGAWIDIMKHTPEQVRRIIGGDVRAIFGMSVVETTNIKTKASTGSGTPTIYPSYAIAYQSYVVVNWGYYTYMVTGASKFDPADQMSTVSVKKEIGALVQQNEGLIVALSQTALA